MNRTTLNGAVLGSGTQSDLIFADIASTFRLTGAVTPQPLSIRFSAAAQALRLSCSLSPEHQQAVGISGSLGLVGSVVPQLLRVVSAACAALLRLSGSTSYTAQLGGSGAASLALSGVVEPRLAQTAACEATLSLTSTLVWYEPDPAPDTRKAYMTLPDRVSYMEV
jgi:hypothetical protein